MKNKVQLIAYVDRFGGGDLAALRALLTGALAGVFGGVHLLPFYDPIDGADAGFDPIDHTRVDPRLGRWSDVMALSRELDVMADVIVNHLSDRSPQFLDYSQHGKASAFDGLFLTRDAVFGDAASAADLAAIYRPRPGSPFVERTLDSGETVQLWCTFTPHQIDIDTAHVLGQAYLRDVLTTLSAGGVRMIRLDAVGYAVKKPGTSCFMLPETFDFIRAMAADARALGIEVLVEVHSYYARQIEIAQHVDWVYDFALPPLLLHAFAFATASPLKKWIAIRPRNAITVLDTHDGIGIVDIGADPSDRPGRPGLVPPGEIDALVEHIHRASNGQSRLATGAAASNLDLYQVNCTYFDALGGDETRYLLARAVQFFLPGIPQVYYVGLMGTRNDMTLLAASGVGRDINRHHFYPSEIEQQLGSSLVQQLIGLIRLRNQHPAFAGEFRLLDTPERMLGLRWEHGAHYAELRVAFDDARYSLRYSAADGVPPVEFARRGSID